MRNRIFGGIGVVWGGLVLVRYFFVSSPPETGARQAGSTAALVLAGLMFVVGLYYLIKGDSK